MDARVERFREAMAQHGAGGVGRRYPVELRALAVAVAADRKEEPLARVAADLGVTPLSLRRWLEPGEAVRFRPVEIEPGSAEAPGEAPASGVALITPRGYRVEGLAAWDLVSLLRALE